MLSKVASDETVTIDLKYGEAFNTILKENNITVTKSFTTNIKALKEYFDSTLTHENLLKYVLKSQGIEEQVLDTVAYNKLFTPQVLNYIENYRIGGKYRIKFFVEKSQGEVFDKLIKPKILNPAYKPKDDEIYIWLVSKDYKTFDTEFVEVRLGKDVGKDIYLKNITREDVESLILKHIKNYVNGDFSDRFIKQEVSQSLLGLLLYITSSDELKEGTSLREVFNTDPTLFYTIKIAEVAISELEAFKISEERWNPKSINYNPIFGDNTMDNAFMCGLWNGLIEQVQAIPELAKFFSEMYGSETEFKKFIDGIKKLVSEGKLIETILVAALKDYDEAFKENNMEKVYYHLASDTVQIISLIIGFYQLVNGAVGFINFTKKALLFIKTYGRKGIKKLKGLNKKQVIEIFDELDEIKLSIEEQYIRLRKTKRYKEIKKWIDKDRARAFDDHEIKSFIDYEKKMATKLRASKSGEAGDAIIIQGPHKGKSIDAVGIPRDAIIKANRATRPRDRFLPRFKNSIQKHFNKVDRDGLDFVVVDFANIDEFDKLKIIEYINAEFKDYIKQGRLIKLNE